MTFDPESIVPPGAKIKVIGVGGGGGNAVNTMIRSNLEGVDFITCNTDVQALRFSLAPTKLQVGKELTKGLGAGADPDIGRDAALEDRHELQKVLEGADMVFITAGMGGGTGTGGASVVAQIARELGALTVAVVTKPFGFEGKRRRRQAELGVARLRECVDTLITIPNQRLLEVATPNMSMVDAFKMADEVLVNAVKGISDIINIPGTVNVDFADVKTVMSCMGQALMGIGAFSGEGRATHAAEQAIKSPLLEDIDIEGATGILLNITAGEDVTLMEVNEACSVVQEAAHEDANFIFGAVIDESLGEEMRVTVIATGFPVDEEETDAIQNLRGKSIINQTVLSSGVPHRITSNPLATGYSTPLTQRKPLVEQPIIEKPAAAPIETPQVPQPQAFESPKAPAQPQPTFAEPKVEVAPIVQTPIVEAPILEPVIEAAVEMPIEPITESFHVPATEPLPTPEAALPSFAKAVEPACASVPTPLAGPAAMPAIPAIPASSSEPVFASTEAFLQSSHEQIVAEAAEDPDFTNDPMDEAQELTRMTFADEEVGEEAVNSIIDEPLPLEVETASPIYQEYAEPMDHETPLRSNSEIIESNFSDFSAPDQSVPAQPETPAFEAAPEPVVSEPEFVMPVMPEGLLSEPGITAERLEGATVISDPNDTFSDLSSFEQGQELCESLFEDDSVSSEPALAGTQEQQTEAPLDALFGSDDDFTLTSDIDQRIDEALELAERLKPQADRGVLGEEDDDLDVPAFLRNGMKDLPLT